MFKVSPRVLRRALRGRPPWGETNDHALVLARESDGLALLLRIE
jgi:hypothetical protein